MAEMKFKFTIQPYQTEAVDSVVGVFAGQPFNDHFTYRRDVEIKRDVTNWMPSDEELYMGFANAKVQLDYGQLLDNIHRLKKRKSTVPESCFTISPLQMWFTTVWTAISTC